jgi:hypothetical protein
MAAQKGKDLLLKIDSGGGAYVTVAGLRSKRIAFNSETTSPTRVPPGAGANCSPAAACSVPPSAARASSRTPSRTR